MVSKVYEIDEAVMKKSKKHNARTISFSQVPRLRIDWSQMGLIRGSPDPADPADQVAGAAARTLPSTRAGGQDDGS